MLICCTLALIASGAGWIATRPHAGPGGSATAASVPMVGVTPPQPLTDAQLFSADRYFPAQHGIDLYDFKARRTTAKQGADCTETLRDHAHDVLHDTGCQGYVSVGFSRADTEVVASVTVLRFPDAASAEKARQVLDRDREALAFLAPTPAATTPATAAPHPGDRPLTGSRVEAVGHYVTVTVSHYADLRTANPDPADGGLDAATRAVSFTAGAPFAWM